MVNSYSVMMLLTVTMVLFSTSCKHDSYTQIGSQKWLRKNLSTTVYLNGDSIPYISDKTEWSNANYGAWTWYENDKFYDSIYGKLYNWYAVNDKRKICPKGWHLPSAEEWEELAENMGGKESAAKFLKSEKLWEHPRAEIDNTTGFDALPGGNRKDDGSFNGSGLSGTFWTSKETDEVNALAYFMNRAHSRVGNEAGKKTNGLSCRCIKDQDHK